MNDNPRQSRLTSTHFHVEHGFGAQAFSDETIVYNRTQHEELRDKGRVCYLGMFRVLGEAVAEQVEGAFVDPHLVFDVGADLDLGGKVVRVRTLGRRTRAGSSPSRMTTAIAKCSSAVASPARGGNR